MSASKLSRGNVRSANLSDVPRLEPLIRFAYRGGKEKVS